MSEPHESSRGHAVVVDDEPNVARVITSLLERDGWSAENYQNPLEALEAITGGDVDVIITDYSMPGMTGTELIRALRGRGVQAPVLVITAFGTVANAVEAMKSGAFDYLTK